MSNDLVQKKVKDLIEKLGLKSGNEYLKEALFVAEYKSELQEGSKNNYQSTEMEGPNRRLENIGDRFLKLVLAEEMYCRCHTVQEMDDFTQKNESNHNLYDLKLVKASDGYCTIDGAPCENKKGDSKKMISSLTEAIIGAMYLDELERNRTTDFAREFIIEKIIRY